MPKFLVEFTQSRFYEGSLVLEARDLQDAERKFYAMSYDDIDEDDVDDILVGTEYVPDRITEMK